LRPSGKCRYNKQRDCFSQLNASLPTSGAALHRLPALIRHLLSLRCRALASNSSPRSRSSPDRSELTHALSRPLFHRPPKLREAALRCAASPSAFALPYHLPPRSQSYTMGKCPSPRASCQAHMRATSLACDSFPSAPELQLRTRDLSFNIFASPPSTTNAYTYTSRRQLPPLEKRKLSSFPFHTNLLSPLRRTLSTPLDAGTGSGTQVKSASWWLDTLDTLSLLECG